MSESVPAGSEQNNFTDDVAKDCALREATEAESVGDVGSAVVKQKKQLVQVDSMGAGKC